MKDCLEIGGWIMSKKSCKEERWREDLEGFLQPFLACLHHECQRHWAPVYLRGLLGPGERKSMTRLAEEVAPGEGDQINNFISVAPWQSEALQRVLMKRADALVGGLDAHLVVDDTGWPKKGSESVGVAPQYCGQLGKKANCQVALSLTLARAEVPVPIALRLFLPQAWEGDEGRRAKCGVPDEVRHEPKWQMALEEIDRAREAGVRFGDVLADAEYGKAGEFRAGLSERGLLYGVGIPANQNVYVPSARAVKPRAGGRGRPARHCEATRAAHPARGMIARQGKRAWRRVSWRKGTKGALSCQFACVRVRVADDPHTNSAGQHLPGSEAWLIGERRESGETKYYLSNLPVSASRRQLVALIKGRWVCEQGHQQMKEELGLNDFEGRSWRGLHHHMLMTMIAMAFLQSLRLKGKKNRAQRRSASPAHFAPVAPRHHPSPVA